MGAYSEGQRQAVPTWLADLFRKLIDTWRYPMWEQLDELMVDDLKYDESFGDGTVMQAEDGCDVEPDGVCPHGYMSPALRLGMI